MAERICKVVERAKRLGVLGPQLVAAVLRIPLHEAEALLASMESTGLVERLRAGERGCPCSRCPLARVCPWSRGGGAGAVLYKLTEKARRLCRDP